ncbi:MAG: glucose-6-phosphate dehydrogenase [Deltaproteobacteria bacterium]|nr:glucose-6-phosphate dehydrogenase [Deltaproteobacteria bacterium]
MSGTANPLRQGLVEDRSPEPCTVVIFGASGDLTKRKLVPALFSLFTERLLPPSFAVVGYARKAMSDDDFRAEMHEWCKKFARHKPTDDQWARFAPCLSYQTGDYEDPEAYAGLKARLAAIDTERGISGNRIFYLSTPPATFPIAVQRLAESGLTDRRGNDKFTRVIIEKPFGTDLDSARALNAHCRSYLREDQIYRIDHYLGKETVQNLMVFRFGNALFEPLWNNRFVDHVQITGAEAIGIEGRGGYFDLAGIVRDMVQNHLFQVLCLTAMEPPVSLAGDDLRDEKVKVLKALRPIPEGRFDDFTVRGQYRAGSVAGKPVPSYQDELGVNAGSTTETFVALKLFIDNWRWAGVPFYLRSGKALPKKVTEVALVFKDTPHRLFGERSVSEPNVLAIRIQPDEGISVRFGSKVPGNTLDIHPVNMEFRYGTSFGAEPPEAYERLQLDCMLGDQALYTRADEVEASWRWISRLHHAWAQRSSGEVPRYEAGSWGPDEADLLLRRDGHVWRRP